MRLYFFALVLLVSFSKCEGQAERIDPNSLFMTQKTNFLGSDTPDTIRCAANDSLVLDMSDLPDISFVDIEYRNGYYWTWPKSKQHVKISNKTLVSKETTKPFDGFKSGDVVLITAGHSNDGTPLNTTVLYATKIYIR